ncbi:hypothetical protein [Paenibacillus sp. OV219]|uniref:hypothetical protein n=1 Tax=Paenibacillus sp. OV219 TaxID=1884377 RepID=UPI0008B35EAE|nr:hypothetical protein [Paenibacillus sp. OV219]SEP16938.1 hypothetical protein SAMN05518847_1243 [Paenibacillus sp. OV219]
MGMMLVLTEFILHAKTSYLQLRRPYYRGETHVSHKNENKKILKMLLVSLILTTIAVFITFWGVFATLMSIFKNQSPEAQHEYLMESFFSVMIFIIIFCTVLIYDKLDKR